MVSNGEFAAIQKYLEELTAGQAKLAAMIYNCHTDLASAMAGASRLSGMGQMPQGPRLSQRFSLVSFGDGSVEVEDTELEERPQQVAKVPIKPALNKAKSMEFRTSFMPRLSMVDKRRTRLSTEFNEPESSDSEAAGEEIADTVFGSMQLEEMNEHDGSTEQESTRTTKASTNNGISVSPTRFLVTQMPGAGVDLTKAASNVSTMSNGRGDIMTRRRKRLQRVLKDHEEDRFNDADGGRRISLKSSQEISRFRNDVKNIRKHPKRMEWLLDGFFAMVICANAVYVGFEIDYGQKTYNQLDFWLAATCVFSILFWTELLLKLRLHGFRNHFYKNEGWIGNRFDATIVLTDTFQLVMPFLLTDKIRSGMPSAGLFRMLRLFRLLRLTRLLRSPVFKDVVAMGQAVYDGLTTLSGALMLVFFVLYVTSLVCRELLGERTVPHVGPYFTSVPRSLFTLFRCSFGDCESDEGLPIIEYMVGAYGSGWGVLYCLFVFVITIGFFNVFTAVFLESATSVSLKKQRGRLTDKKLWSSGVWILVKKILETSPGGLPPHGKLSDCLDEILEIKLPRSELNQLIKHDKDVQKVLSGLDIDPDDHGNLGDILDADHSSFLTVVEIINGIQRLRGSNLKRSDVVCIDLMVRDLQHEMHELREDVQQLSWSAYDPSCLSPTAYDA